MRYEIDENNAVWGYEETQPIAILFQPNWPSGEAFKDRAEATAWAELWLAHMTDSENNAFPARKPE